MQNLCFQGDVEILVEAGAVTVYGALITPALGWTAAHAPPALVGNSALSLIAVPGSAADGEAQDAEAPATTTIRLRALGAGVSELTDEEDGQVVSLADVHVSGLTLLPSHPRIQPLVFPDAWAEQLASICASWLPADALDAVNPAILLVGERHAGKSTFGRFAVNSLLSRYGAIRVPRSVLRIDTLVCDVWVCTTQVRAGGLFRNRFGADRIDSPRTGDVACVDGAADWCVFVCSA